ncbi:hypothetical protein ACFZAR_37110 [Streptomyces sp. NPDC008222]|uniref:hypothetical protein n=1 Tax=Streptomyces sp. NPDC008222 TaxID=3364820 RepID=UPI0036EE32B9
MADEQYRWLDGDAAERLLRGEPLDAIDDDARDQAARLAETLAALAVTPPSTSEELPGEAAALAAFRAARTGADQAWATSGRPDPAYAAHRAADAGLVRLGRPAANGRGSRWGRPLRFGLAAALAAGMIGGVAVAAGTGALPTPFRKEPGPEASVSAAVSPSQPPLTPTPGATETGTPLSSTPDAGGSAPDGSSHDEAGAGPGATGSASPGGDDHRRRHTGTWWLALRSSCRDMTVGRELRADRLRDLQDAAGGSGRVKTFCKGVLGDGEGRSGDGLGSGQDGNGRGGEGGHGQGDGGDDHGGSGGDEGHIRPGGSGLFGVPSGASPAPISALSTPNPV